METHTVEMNKEVLSTKTLYEGSFKRIEVNKYWDSHGKEVDWGHEGHNFDTEVQVKITSSQVKYNFGPQIKPQIFEEWHVYVDGKRFDKEFELTGYKALKTKLVLHACVGAG